MNKLQNYNVKHSGQVFKTQINHNKELELRQNDFRRVFFIVIYQFHGVKEICLLNICLQMILKKCFLKLYINFNADSYPQSIVTLRGMSLKNVTEFRYLGSCKKYNKPNTNETEINQCIQMAPSKFTEMSNLLQNFSINLKSRVMFLNSSVRSRLSYACQNWNITKS